VAQHRSAAPQGPLLLRALGWLTGHWTTASVVTAVLIAAIAGSVAAAVHGAGAHATGETTSGATTPAPEVSVVAANRWLTGPADKLLGSVSTDAANVSKALRSGESGRAAVAGRQLAAVAKTALDGPMPPVDAPLYRSALTDLGKAGTDAAAGRLGAVGPLLTAGTTEITKVTAAADLVAPVNPPAPVLDPNG
jgi:hypothetical protein